MINQYNTEVLQGSDIFSVLCMPETLEKGWSSVFSNGGAGGGDGENIKSFFLNSHFNIKQLSLDLKSGLYRPGPYRKTTIPKRLGGTRSLSIPCIRDRVVQSALYQLLLPIIEPEMEPLSFAYRPGRSVKQATAAVERFRDEGYTHVIDADIKSFFDNVPHDKMLKKLGAYITDERILDLISLWLKAGSANGKGLPQGSPISPILANIYLDDLDEAFQKKDMYLVRFADDFVILCKSAKKAEDILSRVDKFLREEGLQLHPGKTRIVSFEQGFRFLGYLFLRSMTLKSKEKGNLVESSQNYPYFSLADLPKSVEDTPKQNSEQITVENHGLSPVIRPLYLYTSGRELSLKNEAFAVYEEGALLAAFPPERVDRIEVGPNVEINQNAIRQAVAHNIPFIFVSDRGTSEGCVSQESILHGKLHMAQAKMCLDPQKSIEIAKIFAEGRIHNQKALLYRLNRRRKDINVSNAAKQISRISLKLAASNSINAVRGTEGQAAALYWPALGKTLEHGFCLDTRGRREKKNPIALILDFASALLIREIETLVQRHGLHPGFAFLHSASDHSSPCVYDLIEAFRAPLAESITVYVFNNRILSNKHFGENDDGSIGLFPTGRERFIRAYESKMNDLILDPRTNKETIWRSLINNEVLAFKKAIEDQTNFLPYRMSY